MALTNCLRLLNPDKIIANAKFPQQVSLATSTRVNANGAISNADLCPTTAQLETTLPTSP